MLGSIGILFLLILLNGIFAASEIAIVSVNKSKVKQSAEQGDKKAILLLRAIEEPSKILATVQIGVSFIGLFSGAYAADTFAKPIVELLIGLNVPIAAQILKPIIFLFIAIIFSYFILVLGELVPKQVAIKKAIPLALGFISFLNAFSALVHPFVKILSASTDFILKLLGFGSDKDDKDEDDFTKEEIRLLVESGSEQGSIDESEHDMINNIFEFDTKSAEDVCIHRVDVVALPIDAEIGEVIEILTDQTYSRIPVYDDTIDDILGVLHVKDVMKFMLTNGDLKEFNLKDYLREPYFVPFSKKTDELFKEMQKLRVHMAVVIDEYGGTLGIITMEDLVEEIMGNIFDEHDAIEQPEIEKIDENTYSIQGTTDLENVADFFEVALPIEDYDTIGGFIIGQIGHIPAENEKPEIEFNGLLFKVESVFEKRVQSIIVVKL